MRLLLRRHGARVAAWLIAAAFWPTTGILPGPARAFAQNPPKLREPGLERPLEKPDGSDPSAPRPSAGQEKTDDTVAKERRSAAIFRLTHEHPLSSDTGRNPRIEAALDETVNFEIRPQPLRDTLELLATKFGIPIVTDRQTLDDANVDLGQEVKLTPPGLSLRDALDSLLSIEAQPLSFIVRRGNLIVTTLDKANEDQQVVVYDCRDLAAVGTLDHYPSQNGPPQSGQGASGGAIGGGTFEVQQQAPDPAVKAQNGPQQPKAPIGADGATPKSPPVLPAPGVPGAPSNPGQQPATAEPAPRLPIVQTILAALGPDAWDEGASMTELGGLIIVRQNRVQHDKIKNLLADIRRMRANGAFASSAKAYDDETKRRAEAEARARATKESQRATTATDSNKTRPAESHPAAPGRQ
jgi:hypothetical protein